MQNPHLKIEMWGTLILYSSELGLPPRGDFYLPLWLEKRGFSIKKSRVLCTYFGVHLSRSRCNMR